MKSPVKPKKMGKNKEKKKQKPGGFLETAPICIPASETLQKDQLHLMVTSNGKESSKSDISASLEASSEKRKKKKKRKDLSEQHTEDECSQDQRTEEHQENRKIKKKKRKDLSEQHAEDECSQDQHTEEHQENRKIKKKKKMKLRDEEVDDVKDSKDEEVEKPVSTEEPPRKKKKKEKTKEVNEAEGLEIENDERSEEPPTRKKKKKRKLKLLQESNEEKRKDSMNLIVESETRSKEKPAKKKKKKRDVSKDEDRDNLAEQNNDRDVSEEDTGIGISEDAAIDANLLKELKEFIPDIESKKPVMVSKMIKYDLPRFKQFKKRGITVTQGRFTAEENEKLRKNVKDFMALTAVDSASKLFFTHRYKQEQENIKKLKVMHKFFERIAEGISRSCYYVYARGRRMFDEQNYQGEFTKTELHNLNKLHTLHGNNWKKISELTGRSAFSLQKRYTQLADKEGPWSNKEVQRLLRAVRDHIVSQIPGGASSMRSIRVVKETLYKRLPLQKIAMKVKTRSWTQCREKWMGILAVKMSFGTVHTEKRSLDDQVKLIKWMYEVDVQDAANVDWEDLTALLGDVPPAYVQRKWHKLKVSHVPEWQTKCFADIVDFLYEKVLPQLEEKLMSYKDSDETQHKENEESYLLSDIFADINEDEDVEEEDDD